MELYLIRHTTPDIEKGICYGQSDIPLTKTYATELKNIKNKIPLERVSKIYSSPLIRCTTLAKDISESYDTDDRLKELNFGAWEMKLWNEIPKREIDPWMQDFVNTKVPQGESYTELQHRVVEFYKSLDFYSDETVVVITHAGPMRALLSYLRNIDLKDSFQIKINYGEVIKI